MRTTLARQPPPYPALASRERRTGSERHPRRLSVVWPLLKESRAWEGSLSLRATFWRQMQVLCNFTEKRSSNWGLEIGKGSDTGVI